MRKLSPVAGKQHRAVAQLGSALRSGRRGREFKSRQPDHFEKPHLRVRLFAYLPQFAASSGPAGSAPLPSSASRSITPVHDSPHNQPDFRADPSTSSTTRPEAGHPIGRVDEPTHKRPTFRFDPSTTSTNQPGAGHSLDRVDNPPHNRPSFRVGSSTAPTNRPAAQTPPYRIEARCSCAAARCASSGFSSGCTSLRSCTKSLKLSFFAGSGTK